MATQPDAPHRPTAGWVVAAIVAVVAVCAVSFMVSQRSDDGVAVAAGDRAPAAAAPVVPAADASNPVPSAVTVHPADGADGGRLRAETAPVDPPRETAFDANAAGSNASAIEPAH